jgi:hypothetical protein
MNIKFCTVSCLLWCFIGLSQQSRLAHYTKAMSVNLEIYDAIQVQLMDELCILVDENDKVVGSDTKKNCSYDFDPS